MDTLRKKHETRRAKSSNANAEDEDEDESKWAVSYLTQLRVLTHRCMLNSKSAIFTKLNFTKSILLGVIVGCCWYRRGMSEKYVNDRAAFVFFAMTYW